MLVKYCNADCQKNHWSKHKKVCKIRAAELRDEALFKDPPAKEDCPICFLPMPIRLISCITLPPATIRSVPIYDYSEANEELANKCIETYYSCCGKYICCGCVDSFHKSGNHEKCPFCKSERIGNTNKVLVGEMMRRVDVNDAGAMYMLGNYYDYGTEGVQQDRGKAKELYARAAELGSSQAHFALARIYDAEGNSKKEKFHYEAAAMAGHECARFNLGITEGKSGKEFRAVKHLRIAASAGDYGAMNALLRAFNQSVVSRNEINSILEAYNKSCVEMRSEARDAAIRVYIASIGAR
jgi:TPR repeat protein